MPLIKSSTTAARRKNIREMIRAGHTPERATAAAFRNQRQHAAKKRKAEK